MTNTPQAAQPADSFEAHLFRLDEIMRVLRPVMEAFETEDLDDDALNKALINVVKTLNPKLTKKETKELACMGVMTLAFTAAGNETYSLLSTWKLAQHDVNPIAAGVLLQQFPNSQVSPTPGKLVSELPWILRGVLDFILNDGVYEKNPESGSAVAARILACILSSFEGAEGFNWDPPEGEDNSAHPSVLNVIPFPITEETRCRVLGIERNDRSSCTQYVGTKEQLLNANVATLAMFPKKRSWARSSKRSDPALGKWSLSRFGGNGQWLLTCHKMEVRHD